MEMKPRSRASVSRETRLLLFTALIALSALWVLARLRFPERPATANPVPPILAQLTPPRTFEDLASSVSDLEPGLAAAFLVLEPSTDAAPGVHSTVVALRIQDEVAIAVAPEASLPVGSDAVAVLARDPVSGLTLLRSPAGSAVTPTAWTPRRPASPRYLIAADAGRGGVALRPVFVGRLDAIVSPVWLASLWAMPAQTDVEPGTFLFTIDGELAGVVSEHDGAPAIVPGDTLIERVDRLQNSGGRTQGRLGIEVQHLTPAIGKATGADQGVIVTWVDPAGPAAGLLAATDVVEAADNAPVLTPAHWLARTGRLAAGESIQLRVRRRGKIQEIVLTADAAPVSPATRSLGLTLRRVPGVGVEVLRVAPESAAAHAGLKPGDVIGAAGDYNAPTAAQISTAFDAGDDDRPMLLAVARGAVHLVLTLEK